MSTLAHLAHAATNTGLNAADQKSANGATGAGLACAKALMVNSAGAKSSDKSIVFMAGSCGPRFDPMNGKAAGSSADT